jgi:hypothetical protein
MALGREAKSPALGRSPPSFFDAADAAQVPGSFTVQCPEGCVRANSLWVRLSSLWPSSFVFKKSVGSLWRSWCLFFSPPALLSLQLAGFQADRHTCCLAPRGSLPRPRSAFPVSSHIVSENILFVKGIRWQLARVARVWLTGPRFARRQSRRPNQQVLATLVLRRERLN